MVRHTIYNYFSNIQGRQESGAEKFQPTTCFEKILNNGFLSLIRLCITASATNFVAQLSMQN